MPTSRPVEADPETGEIAADPFATDGDGNPMPAGTYVPVGDIEYDDAFSALLDLVERDVKGWRPEPGERLWGIVADIGEGESEFGPYPLITINSPAHEELVGLHAFHSTLKRDIENALIRKTLVIGSRIAVSYRGLGEASRGNSAPHIYRVGILPPVA